MMEQFQRELGGSFRLSPQVREFLKSYAWPGNIRELRNVVEYFLYTGHDPITVEDLPPRCSGRQTAPPPGRCRRSCRRTADAFRFVLEQLYLASESHCSLGRDRLLQLAKESFIPTSQQEIRSILSRMAERGLVRVTGAGAAVS